MPYTIADENTRQSPYSPGIVEPAEMLLRLGFHPEHTEDGEIVPAAISREDLAERGFSVDRQSHVKRRVIEERACNLMANVPAKRQEALISSFSCGAVRELQDHNNERAFIVIDTAKDDNHAHASIYSAIERKPGQLKKVRNSLLQLLQSYTRSG